VELFGAKDNVQNDDVQALLGVSDATATRYLEELEQGAKIQQVGKTEHSVYYVQK
jgi:Fic family protein